MKTLMAWQAGTHVTSEAKDTENKNFLPVSGTREMEVMTQNPYLKER